MKFKGTAIWRILLAVYLMTLFYLCFGHFEADDSVPKAIFGIPSDKIVHFLMFMPAVPLLLQSLPRKWFKDIWIGLCLILLAGVATGIVAGIVEIFQGFTLYRSCDLYDFYADMIGIALACAGMLVLNFCQKNLRSQK